MRNEKNKSFGSFVKDLRHNKGLSIKNLGSKLDINYSYISKIENDHSIPSEDFIKKVAEIFGHDKEELMLRAGKIPGDIIEILKNNPKAAADFLRKKFVSPRE
ncbi:MAG: helix-turn-helix transcriptional regulator [Deltaproteobacteria bacterium]|nr:helix-turn-helix transcriptional regulator [Deltaproteobacteria bacterium]